VLSTRGETSVRGQETRAQRQAQRELVTASFEQSAVLRRAQPGLIGQDDVYYYTLYVSRLSRPKVGPGIKKYELKANKWANRNGKLDLNHEEREEPSAVWPNQNA
jgi:hypothetical protein